MAKTSHTAAGDALINLLYLDTAGVWTSRVFATVADNVTRASVVIDAEHHDLYVFAAGPCCAGGTIYYKKTTLANPQFGRGSGTPFISSAAHPEANNVTSTKQTVSPRRACWRWPGTTRPAPTSTTGSTWARTPRSPASRTRR